MKITTPLVTRDANKRLKDATWRAPVVPDGDSLLFDEPGRVLVLKPESNYDVCYQSYWFRVTAAPYGLPSLRVKHGGGEESWSMPDVLLPILAAMDSDQRYFMLHSLMRAHHESTRAATARVELTYKQAFVDGRLKKRKVRGQNRATVWIEST